MAPHSSSGSRATSSTWPALSKSAYVVSRPEPATCEARNERSSSLERRERKSIESEPTTVRANFDQAQASSKVRWPPGRKPTDEPACSRPSRTRSSASDQEVGTSLPSSRTSG